jgi:four helix bundle protein
VGSQSFRDLLVWQQAIELVDLVYVCTKTWPRDEAFGLTSQIRRAAVSVPANIAEGQGRNGRREFVKFLGIANGSLCELETLVIARRQDYLASDHEIQLNQQSRRVASLLNGLIKSLRSAD